MWMRKSIAVVLLGGMLHLSGGSAPLSLAQSQAHDHLLPAGQTFAKEQRGRTSGAVAETQDGMAERTIHARSAQPASQQDVLKRQSRAAERALTILMVMVLAEAAARVGHRLQ